MSDTTTHLDLITDDDMQKLNELLPDLTFRQFSILHLFSLGMSIKNISSHTKTSDQNIKNHLKIVRDKLNCSCSQDLRLIYITKILISLYLK